MKMEKSLVRAHFLALFKLYKFTTEWQTDDSSLPACRIQDEADHKTLEQIEAAAALILSNPEIQPYRYSFRPPQKGSQVLGMELRSCAAGMWD